MDSTYFSRGGATESADFQGVSPVSRLVNADSPYLELLNPQGTFPTPLLRSSRAPSPLENPDLQCPPVMSPALARERAVTDTDQQNKRSLLPGASLARTDLQSSCGLPHTNSCGQVSKCSSMFHQKRNHTNSFSANLEQQSAAHFNNAEQQCANLNSSNSERRDHIDSCSAKFERMMYSNKFSAGLEQRNHVNNLFANPEQSTHVNSSAGSCCQPSKHNGRHGEPLYKSLLRPHHYSHSPLMDYVDGPHHLHHHTCAFEAENHTVNNHLPRQCTDCISCRFGFSTLNENNTNRGSVSKGQSYYSLRALSNEITLCNWYLVRSSGSESSEIAVGGFLSNRGMENERIETSTIVKRLEDCKVLTKDGNVINLVGPIDDYRTVSNGFSLQTVHLFISGFPHIWNLVVGMGLPAKGVGTDTPSLSRDFYGGEVTLQVSLQKDIQTQGKCMHQSSAPEGKVNEITSCLEVERPQGLKFVTEKGCKDVEAVAKVPESVVVQELQEQGNILLNVEDQVSKDQLPSIVQVHEEEDTCINPVGAGSDKETGLVSDCQSEHEASHGQMECTAKQATELMRPTCEIENMPIESAETAMTESRSEDKERNIVAKLSTIQDNTLEEIQDKKDIVEARADATKPLDLQNDAGTGQISDEKLDLTSVQSLEISDCRRESRMAKITKPSHSMLSRKRKVTFSLQDDVEMEHLSCTSLNLETSTKSLGKSCSLNSKGVAEHVPLTKSTDGEKSMGNKLVTAKQKGKRKKKGRVLLPKYKRSSKPMVTCDSHKDTKDGKVAREVCNDKELEAGCKRQKSPIRNSKLTDVQSGVVLSQPSFPDKSAEGKATVTALVLEPIINKRVKTRQKDNEKAYIKRAAQKKMIAKKRKGCLAKLQHTLNEERVHNEMDNDDQVLSMIGTQKPETKVRDSLTEGSRRQKSGEADSDLHLSTPKPIREKLSKKIERGVLEDSTCKKETLNGFCNTQAHAECDSSLSTIASPRKRLKQILPPPLPLPFVSVSKQLVSKAFGLKTSRSGRLLVPPLAHWRGQSLVRDMDGGIIAIEDGSEDAPREDTGCFTFKPPMEARAKKLQKWLCETATVCLTKKLKARKNANSHKQKCIST